MNNSSVNEDDLSIFQNSSESPTDEQSENPDQNDARWSTMSSEQSFENTAVVKKKSPEKRQTKNNRLVFDDDSGTD